MRKKKTLAREVAKVNDLGWVGAFAILIGGLMVLAHKRIDAANSRATAKIQPIENERQTRGGAYSPGIIGIGLLLVVAGVVLVILSLGQA